MRLKSFQLIIFLAVAAFFSCSDPALIGSELLEEDQANLQFTTEVPVQAKTIKGTPLQTYSPFVALQLSRHLFGNYQDPIMGNSQASIYTQIALGPQDPPTVNIKNFDSIVLSLAYDTLGGYGDISQPFGMEVFLLEEDMVNIDDYFSDQTFQTNPTSIGSVAFIPNLEDRITIKDFTSNPEGDTISVSPHVRIPLSGDFEEMLGQDTLLFRSDTAFQAFFKGIHIRPSETTTPGMLSFDFSNNISRISLYYKDGGEQKEFQLDFNGGNSRVLNLAHDYSGSRVGPALENKSDSLLFIQGMIGVNTQITFPDVSDFQNIVVNKAELEFTVASIEGNNLDTYPLSTQLVASQVNNDERAILSDVRSALFSQDPIRTEVFGGVPVVVDQDGVIVTKYRINISGYFQRIIENTAENSFNLSTGVEQTSWYFQIPPKPTDPSRVIFYGPNHPVYPMKLNLTYTKL